MSHSCLKKLYVRFRHLTPNYLDEPQSCDGVTITKSPEIRIFTGQLSKLEGAKADEIIGLSLHCVVPYTTGAGGLILLLQVSAYIEWEYGFVNKRGQYVTEFHRLFISIPMMYKLKGPLIALMAVTPWKLKLPRYAVMIAAAFVRLDEVEKILGKIASFSANRCSSGFKEFLESLETYERELNKLLQRAATGADEMEIAKRMKSKSHGVGRFAGTTRIA